MKMKIRWILIVALIMLGLVVVGHSFVRARNTRAGPPCRNNLMLVDGGKETWAWTKHIPTGTAATVEDILPYVKGHQMPRCHWGKTNEYVIGRVGEEPRCPVHGGITDYATPPMEKLADWWHGR